ncbi:TetR/AcrR family transcriptional regulator [Nocardioides montaniterrae]
MSASPYHHGRLRESLIEAAVAAVRENGHEGLALRDLARRVGVSHNAAYRHFADRDELVTEVAGWAMEQLVASMEKRLAGVRTREPVLRARRRLAETGRGYVDFALAEPGLFRLAFASTSAWPTTWPTAERDPFAILSHTLDDLVEVGFLSPEARVDAEITCWSAVHGFSMLHTEGALHGTDAKERDTALDRVLIAIDRSYAATTGAEIGPDDLRARRR